jgi:hypothetical protein
VRRTGASGLRLPGYPACSATCLTGISHGELLSVHKRGQAWPDAPEEAENCLGNPRFSLLPLLPLRENLQVGNHECICGFGIRIRSRTSVQIHWSCHSEARPRHNLRSHQRLQGRGIQCRIAGGQTRQPALNSRLRHGQTGPVPERYDRTPAADSRFLSRRTGFRASRWCGVAPPSK